MNNAIYVLYDPSVENEKTLEDFYKILVLAGFKKDTIIPITLDAYISELESNNYTFYNYVIAINQTYKQINTIYSDKLNEPIYDFFSKEFVHLKNNLVLFGLLFSVETIYSPSYKKFSWGTIQRFYSECSKLIENKTTEPVCDYLSDPLPEKETIVINAKEHEVIEEIQEDKQESNLTYEELLNFYKETSKLFSQFNLIENKIKHIGSLLDE